MIFREAFFEAINFLNLKKMQTFALVKLIYRSPNKAWLKRNYFFDATAAQSLQTL